MERSADLTEASFDSHRAWKWAKGNDAYIPVPDDSSLDPTTAMTLEAWVFPRVVITGERQLIVKEFPPNSAAYFLGANSQRGR